MIIKTADRIKELREAKSITQTELANYLSITRSSVNAWEMGISTPSTDKLIELAKFFNVTTDYLLGIDDNQTINISSLDNDEITLVHALLHYINSRK